jgi:RHH-type proline utilization regulon transcriptional repressor/proline dehydrogenase/delta 1-pyrroline-5-carboxylate dehydrogenase
MTRRLESSARKLLAATDAIYPQFATHIAHTLAAVYQLAGPDTYAPGQYEFQCLHGMGETLYEQVVGAISEGKLGRPCTRPSITRPFGLRPSRRSVLQR